jgi:hypothetical protein
MQTLTCLGTKFTRMHVNTLPSVISIYTSVISTRRMWFLHAGCDFNTKEYDLYTQSMIFRDRVWFWHRIYKKKLSFSIADIKLNIDLGFLSKNNIRLAEKCYNEELFAKKLLILNKQEVIRWFEKYNYSYICIHIVNMNIGYKNKLSVLKN